MFEWKAILMVIWMEIQIWFYACKWNNYVSLYLFVRDEVYWCFWVDVNKIGGFQSNCKNIVELIFSMGFDVELVDGS